jgi:penicillin-binding protein 1A
MILMMNSVVEHGTGRRARLDGIAASGKTGTTNAYRDAWFMGYTGNFVCGVWFGNDDYTSTNRMTGGSLPAMTWHNIMAYAHQGIEIRPLPGIPAPHERQQQVVAFKTKGGEPPPPPRPVMLTKRGVDILGQIEQMLDDANRALGPPPPTVSAKKERQAQAGKKGDALAADLEGRAFERN